MVAYGRFLTNGYPGQLIHMSITQSLHVRILSLMIGLAFHGLPLMDIQNHESFQSSVTQMTNEGFDEQVIGYGVLVVRFPAGRTGKPN